jgi:hypothetical protein
MPKPKRTQKSFNLEVEAILAAQCGNVVFTALQHVPTQNLQDMASMIDHILRKRLNQ